MYVSTQRLICNIIYVYKTHSFSLNDHWPHTLGQFWNCSHIQLTYLEDLGVKGLNLNPVTCVNRNTLQQQDATVQKSEHLKTTGHINNLALGVVVVSP